MSAEHKNCYFGLEGKVALVTAAAGGFGTAISRGLAEYGANLLLTDIRDEAVIALTKDITQSNSNIRAFATVCDVTSTKSVESAVSLACEKFGKIDILVNIAGAATLKPVLDMEVNDFARTLDSCLVGAYRCSRAVGKAMVDQKQGGSIIHISSIASVAALGRGTGAYAAAKAGMNALVRELAVEWASFGIRINAIAPCQFNTEGTKKVLNNPQFGGPDVLLTKMISKIPIGRLGEPEEMVGPALFLASSASSMITGQVLFVDGGFTAI